MADEIWKPIVGFEGLYEVSNFGRVKSLCTKSGVPLIRKLVSDKDGYLTVCIKKEGKVFCKKVHRLVAEGFISNPYNYPHINHKDEIKTNNNVNNLEWCSARYNNLYHDKCKRCCKRVVKLDLSGNVLQSYPSINEAAADVGVTTAHLSTVLSGRRARNKLAGGYKWKFEQEAI